MRAGIVRTRPLADEPETRCRARSLRPNQAAGPTGISAESGQPCDCGEDRLLAGGAVRDALLTTAIPAARLPARQDSPGYTAAGLVAAGRGRARRLWRPIRSPRRRLGRRRSRSGSRSAARRRPFARPDQYVSATSGDRAEHPAAALTAGGKRVIHANALHAVIARRLSCCTKRHGPPPAPDRQAGHEPAPDRRPAARRRCPAPPQLAGWAELVKPAGGGGGQPQRRPGRPGPLMPFRLAFDQFLDVALGGFDEPGLVIARPYVAGQPSAQPKTRALPARCAPWLPAYNVPPRVARMIALLASSIRRHSHHHPPSR